MDPISAIGLLASISTLIATSKGVVDLIKSLKDGEDELAQLLHDIFLLEEALRGFDRVLRSRQTQHRISSQTLQSAVEEATATLDGLKKRLDQINKSTSATVRRLKWIQNKPHLERIDARIRGQFAQLNSFVTLAHMETFLAVCGQNPDALEVCSTVAGEIQESECSLPSYEVSESSLIPQITRTSPDAKTAGSDKATGMTESRNDTSLYTPGKLTVSRGNSRASRRTRRLSSSASETSKSSLSTRRSSVFSASSVASSTSSLDLDEYGIKKIKSNNTHGSRNSESLSAGSLTIRRACRFDCYCQCHGQSVVVSDKVFSAFNTPAFKDSRGTGMDCTDPDCAGASSSKTKVVVPPTFFKRAISRLMSTKSVKIRYHLNTYRMVPEGSDAMRYVKQGNLNRLKLLIHSGKATPWDTAPDGWSLLHTAAYARQLPIVKYLCEHGADTEVSDLGARKPADLAILKSLGADATRVEAEIVDVFSHKDDYISDFEFTPIHIAVLDLYDPSDAERPSLEQLIEFVDNANNAPPRTDWATWKRRYQNRSPLYLDIIEQFRVSAVESTDSHKIIHNLLDQKDRKFHWTPLHWASSTGRVERMKMLIDHGADPFIQSNLDASIVHAAVESNAERTLAYSLEICKRHPGRLGLDQPNIWGESPLIMAAQGCLVGCVRLLLEAGADRNVRQENQQVALHYAGLSMPSDSRRETVSLLCSGEDGAGPHINAQDEDGRPPIFEFHNDPKTMQIILDHGAEVDLSDDSGKTIFHLVCVHGEVDVLEILLNQPDDISAAIRVKNGSGNTAFIEALRHESVDCAMAILKLRDIGDIVGQDGWAAVHYATKMGNPDLLEAVLKHPSFEKNMKTEDGKTAQTVAMESGNWCGLVKELLKTHNSIT